MLAVSVACPEVAYHSCVKEESKTVPFVKKRTGLVFRAYEMQSYPSL